MNIIQEDPRMMNVFLALMKNRFKDLGMGDPTAGDAPSPSPAPTPAPEKKEEKKKESEPEPMGM